MFASTSKALIRKRAFGRYTDALAAIDLSTRFKICKLICSHASLEVELEALRVEVHGSGHTLRVLRLDNEFVTAAIETSSASSDDGRCDIQEALWQETPRRPGLGHGVNGLHHEVCTDCPYELWTDKHPDLVNSPTIPFGSAVIELSPRTCKLLVNLSLKRML